jgi:isobutylamine N-monooxygenase
MRSLDTAIDTCDRYHPGLIKSLCDTPLMDREKPGSKVIAEFRAHGGPGLVVPADFGGLGADALDAVRVMRAIGAHSPSLGAAATMHHFTVATMLALADGTARLPERQLAILRRVGPDALLMSSGWAEGKTEQNILNPSMSAVRADGGYLVSGSKKPCSMSRSMDLLTLGVTVPGADGAPALAMMVLPTDSAGITVHPFWSSDIMAAAESDEVRLDQVFVADDLVIQSTAEDPLRFDDLQVAGFVWFELLITAAYTGAASALVSRVLERGRGSATDRATLGLRLEAAIGLVEGMARTIRDGELSEETIGATLVTRFAVQQLLVEAAGMAVELLGGVAFIGSSEIAYLASAVRPLAFHPPSRTSAAQALADFFAGEPLLLG